MKRWIFILLMAAAALPLTAQTNAPVRLALVSESAEAAPVADVLTAQLSGNPGLQLLERDQIAKVYHEQSLSAANTDYLKLGQLLGADGLLLLETIKEGTNEFLNTRLVAVKPGVVLAAEKFSWPKNQGSLDWAGSFAVHLDTLLPKLKVQLKDAVPLSLVNLRSSETSEAGRETERQLKLLAIERLSHEPQIFVLERQQMALLGEEKDLKMDDSAFWNGSYLLDGVVDQNGYSPDTITISARLTPPKGGAPLGLAVSGSRTNLAEVINQLAAQVDAALKIQSRAPAWNSADEAVQYFNEAQWALRWGVYSEAQAAADSAWALGRHDTACATLRIHAYMVSPDAGQPAIYYPPKERPDPRLIASARHALELYNELSSQLPADEPKVDSDWYHLGLESLTTASRVLQVFNWSPDFYKPVADDLAELRAAARAAAEWISRSPSVHDSYFTGDRVMMYDELHHFTDGPSIFSIELDCASLWQDKPEDCLAIYLQLLSSPVFGYFHGGFWFRDDYHDSALHGLPPLLVAWNPADQKRLPAIWSGFVRELNESTNLLCRLEVQALGIAQATNAAQMAVDFTNFFTNIFSHREELVSNPVEIFYLDWHMTDFTERMGGEEPDTGIHSIGTYSSSDFETAEKIKDSLGKLYRSDYAPKLEAMDREYREKTVAGRKMTAAFAAQKEFLSNNTPYDFQKLGKVFENQNYTKTQAAELLPLLTAYKSNLLAQTENKPQIDRFLAKSNSRWIDLFITRNVSALLNTPAPQPAEASAHAVAPRPVAAKTVAAIQPAHAPAQEAGPQILTVDKFLPIPLDGLPGSQISQVAITAHHWVEGKLLLDLQYNAYLNSVHTNGFWAASLNETFPAMAMLDPTTEKWTVISCPVPDFAVQNHYYHHSTLLHGAVYTSDGGQIRKYDFASGQWQALPVSNGENYELFAVNDRLYAASETMIFEILDDGKSTRLLASTRRQPPASTLDSTNLGLPTLFAGPGLSLRASVLSGIYTWADGDWRRDLDLPPAAWPGILFPEGVFFGNDAFNHACLSWLPTETNTPVFGLGNFTTSRNDLAGYQARVTPPPPPRPLWKLPPGLSLAQLPAAVHEADWFLLAGHSGIQDLFDDQHFTVKEKVLDRDGYNVTLLCFSPGLSLSSKVGLKFDSPAGCPPLAGLDSGSQTPFSGLPPAWLLFAGSQLLFASESPISTMSAGKNPPRIGYQAGVWLLPIARLDPLIAQQKATQLTRMAREAASAEQNRKSLLAKYDVNQDGKIDPDEKEMALDDPAFIASELDQIDTNHNGWLDAPELAWFDANQNYELDPREAAGINIAQHLLAQKLFNQFDPHGNGTIRFMDYDELIETSLGVNPNIEPDLQFSRADENHDGQLDAGELEDMMKRHTAFMLQASRTPRGLSAPFFMSASVRDHDARAFETEVDSYWRHAGAQSGSPARLSPRIHAAMEEYQLEFLKKYDHNHNGVLDPDEQDKAKDDPDYSRYMINRLRLKQPPAATPLSPANPP